MNISQQIEAVLFWKAEPVAITKLASLLKTDIESIKKGLVELEQSLNDRGITLVQTSDEVTLGTKKELSYLIEQMTKEELMRELGKAGLETLSIILYEGPISRSDIDYIRGVNSQYILRNLLIRGLIDRVSDPNDARSFLYKPTLDLLAHLGVSKIEELPERDRVRADIESFKHTKEGEKKQNSDTIEA